MNKVKELKIHNVNLLAAVLAFLAAYCFFQFAYPYHLIRREQMNLFLFDWDYILQTYHGSGWLVRLISDFIEQFFHLPAIGPFTVAVLLTAIGTVTYRICSKFMSQWPSLAIATAIYLWSFLRETDNLYITRYTVVFLGYILLILIALQLKKAWSKTAVAVLLLTLGVWAFGSPVHQYYGRLFGVPQIKYDRMIGLDAEVARERWDKVLKLSRKDLYMVEASYCYNLAHAMKGDLGQTLFNHSQGDESTLLLRVSTEKSPFSNCLAGEAPEDVSLHPQEPQQEEPPAVGDIAAPDRDDDRDGEDAAQVIKKNLRPGVIACRGVVSASRREKLGDRGAVT